MTQFSPPGLLEFKGLTYEMNSLKNTASVARLELNYLFYSPVAWLLLLVFCYLLLPGFGGTLEMFVQMEAMAGIGGSLSNRLFTGPFSLFASAQNTIYLFLPLLTMSVFSREFQSGSMTLLNASPISTTSIVLGKYIAIVAYCLLLAGILAATIGIAFVLIPHLEVRAAFVAVAGFILLALAYSAIGVFASSLTRYQIVAALISVAAVALLQSLGSYAQAVPVLGEILFALAFSNKADEIRSGLVGSDNVAYLLTVSILFVSLTIVRLREIRRGSSIGSVVMKYASVLLVAATAAFLLSRPGLTLYLDATNDNSLTLHPNTQTILESIDGPVRVTTYVNVLEPFAYALWPRFRNIDRARFDGYTRFKPEISFDYVYYYGPHSNARLSERYPDLSLRDLAERVVEPVEGLSMDDIVAYERLDSDDYASLASEDFRIIRIWKWGEKAAISRLYEDGTRWAGEAQLAATLRQLRTSPSRTAFVTDAPGRRVYDSDPRNYRGFATDWKSRRTLVSLGFDVAETSLDRKIPSNVDILVVSDSLGELSASQESTLGEYVASGKNLLVLADAWSTRASKVLARLWLGPDHEQVDSEFGSSGGNSKDLIRAVEPSSSAKTFGIRRPHFAKSDPVLLVDPIKFRIEGGGKFETFPVFCEAQEETIGSQDRQVANQSLEERSDHSARQCAYAVGLHRHVGDREQRIVVIGDSDFLSNAEQSRGIEYTANLLIGRNIFRWLSGELYPVSIERPPVRDNRFPASELVAKTISLFLTYVLSSSIALLATILLVRRRRA